MQPEGTSPGDRARLEHMLATARDAIEILGNMTTEEVRQDMMRSRALVACFTEIGEAAARLSDGGRMRAPDVPWRQIVGMRHTIVHVYWGIDLHELVKTVRADLPEFITNLEKALQSWPDRGDG